VVSYLVGAGISTRAALEDDPNSPQALAANWIANTDKFQIELPTNSGSNADGTTPHTRFAERYVLAVFYYATNGNFWKYGANFLTPVDHCEWYTDFLTTTGAEVRLGVSECQTLGEGLTDRYVTILNLRKY
jgi:hypothetical protein